MIYRFHQVNDKLYRGSAPTPHDVATLHDHFGVNRIVSLDLASGRAIDRVTKMLGVEHIMLPIDVTRRSSLVKFLDHDLGELLQGNPNVFVHCAHGKDRTGLAVAMFRCKYEGWTFQDALDEAKSFGFGIGLIHVS